MNSAHGRRSLPLPEASGTPTSLSGQRTRLGRQSNLPICFKNHLHLLSAASLVTKPLLGDSALPPTTAQARLPYSSSLTVSRTGNVKDLRRYEMKATPACDANLSRTSQAAPLRRLPSRLAPLLGLTHSAPQPTCNAKINSTPMAASFPKSDSSDHPRYKSWTLSETSRHHPPLSPSFFYLFSSSSSFPPRSPFPLLCSLPKIHFATSAETLDTVLNDDDDTHPRRR